jgi:uncharacterized OB-fold protein
MLGTMKRRIPILKGILHEGTSSEDKSYLIGSRCRECSRVFFPKRHACGLCMKDDAMEEVRLSTRGKIDTFSVVHVAPTGFKAPYIQAFVDLPEGPRIFSIITECELTEEGIAEGQEVELVIDKIAEDEKGNELIGYKFRPVLGKS